MLQNEEKKRQNADNLKESYIFPQKKEYLMLDSRYNVENIYI